MVQSIITGLLCGALFGFVLQRGRFCITSAFRDLYLTKDNRMFIALLIAISVQSIGVFALAQFGIIQLSPGNLAWLATIVGAFIFGVGIVFAGGCATGTWYRAGEGLIGSWIALATYMLSSAVMKAGVLKSVTSSLQSYQLPITSIHDTFKISPWVLVVLFALLCGFLAWRHLRKEVKIPALKAKKTGLAHLLFEKRWHPFVTAILVGLIAILAWPLSAATGRMFGLGITTPTANLLQYLVSGDVTILNWGVFLVLGIFIGSFIAAKGSGEFRFRAPDATTSIRSFFGGLMMGCGASLAGGCSIGNGLVETALFTWQGWVSLPFMILGTWVAAYFTIIRPQQKKTFQQAATTASS